jgi:hypothetical protein
MYIVLSPPPPYFMKKLRFTEFKYLAGMPLILGRGVQHVHWTLLFYTSHLPLSVHCYQGNAVASMNETHIHCSTAMGIENFNFNPMEFLCQEPYL